MNNTGGIQIRLGDLIYGVLKRWRLILILTFIGLIFGVLISAFSYLQGSYSNYQIDASFVILTKANPQLFTAYGTDYPHPADYEFAAELVDTVDFVMESDRTMNKAIDSLKMVGIKPQDISQNLTLNPMGSTAIVEASFTWRNAEEGIAILNAVLDASQVTLRDTLKIGELSIIDKPAARQSITGTLGGSVWGYMTILGFLAGVGYVILELIMRPTLTNLNDMEGLLGLESLGVIPRDKKYFKNKQSLLVDDNVTSPAIIQNFASTAFIIRNRLSSTTAPHCFYVTSTVTGEGRSTVAANLAVQLSDMECKVLLVDMDNRNPTLGKLFLKHVDYDRSLNALYKGDATVAESIYTLTGYLDLLPMVIDRQPIPMEGTFFDLIKELEKNYEYVIIDTSPVGHYSDVLSLNEIADTVLFVVGYDAATIPEIQTALEKLDKSGIRVLGGVVNSVQNFSGATRNDDDERMMQMHKNRKKEVLVWEKQEGEEEIVLDQVESGPWKRNRRMDRRKGKNKKKNKARKKAKKGKKNTSEITTPDSNKQGNYASNIRAPQKDVLKELMENTQEAQHKRMSDDDARSALFKIGLEGDFDNEESGVDIPEETLVQNDGTVAEKIIDSDISDEISDSRLNDSLDAPSDVLLDTPLYDPSETPSDDSSYDLTDNSLEAPSDDYSDTPLYDPSDNLSNDAADDLLDVPSDESLDDPTDAPSESPLDVPSDDSSDDPSKNM